MVQFNKLWMLYMLLFIATVACSTDEEVTISVDDDGPTITDDNVNYGVKDGRRTFGFISQFIRIFINLAKTFAPHFKNWVMNPNDIFSFVRDYYPWPNVYDEYDYVIIGAGSAGCALASRLSEDPNVYVLLIEAGQPESILTDIPIIAPMFQRLPQTTQYVTEKQEGSCWGMENQRCVWPRGRAVGGTSVVNYMIYTRGRPQDWNRIYNDGCPGWSYDEVLPYYIKSEQCHVKKYQNENYRGRNGKVHINNVNFKTRLVEAFIEAGRLLGHPTVDYNAPNGFGFGYLQTNLKGGHRHSAARAYLFPHLNRENLHILHSTTATKILINNEKIATGVNYVTNNVYYTVKVRREVIVSAGPIASPQLLMLSGIGPADHLKRIGIPVIMNLAVGRTLYDHLYFPGQIYRLNTTSVSLHESKVATPQELIKWLTSGTGLLASPGGIEGIGYIKTSESTDPELVPDIELMDIGGSMLSDCSYSGTQSVRRGARIADETFYDAFGVVGNEDTWSVTPMLLHPKSKGYLELRDTNPFSHPKIYTNYFKDHKDVKTMIAAIRHVQRLAEQLPFQKFGARLHEADYPQCRNHRFDSDPYWECALRTLASSLHHQVGTCKMGPSWDPEAVVDPELRVYNIVGLRVADTSIIPRTTSAHTNAPGMMIGEKAADIIKNAWYYYG